MATYIISYKPTRDALQPECTCREVYRSLHSELHSLMPDLELRLGNIIEQGRQKGEFFPYQDGNGGFKEMRDLLSVRYDAKSNRGKIFVGSTVLTEEQIRKVLDSPKLVVSRQAA